MKRLLLLATAALALTACGTTATSTPTAEIKEQGTLTLNFYKVGAQGLKQLDVFSDKTTNIRVRVSNPTTGFNVVKDVPVSAAGAISVQVPATTGYAVEAISYYVESYSGYYLKEGAQQGIDVAPNTVKDVNLTLQRPNIRLEVPASVVSGAAFTATLSGVTSNFSFCYLQVTNTAKTKTEYFNTAVYGSNGQYTLNAPEYGVSGTMYAYTNCTVSLSDKWKTSDSSVSFLSNLTPNVDLGETPATATLTAPAGGIKIGIGY